MKQQDVSPLYLLDARTKDSEKIASQGMAGQERFNRLSLYTITISSFRFSFVVNQTPMGVAMAHSTAMALRASVLGSRTLHLSFHQQRRRRPPMPPCGSHQWFTLKPVEGRHQRSGKGSPERDKPEGPHQQAAFDVLNEPSLRQDRIEERTGEPKHQRG